jgi:hypothetical protein
VILIDSIYYIYLLMLILSLVLFCICGAPSPIGGGGWGADSLGDNVIDACRAEGGTEAAPR